MLTTAEERLLIHKVWSEWPRIRKTIYERLGINNTEDLISAIKADIITANRFVNIIMNEVGLTANKNKIDKNIRLISIFDKDYPQELLNMQKINEKIYPPLLLYMLTLLNEPIFNKKPIISIVGTRQCTNKGARMAYDIAKRLSRDYIIASGLAKGIDYHATQGTLDSNGTIIEVRPYLLPIDYVNSNEYERILKHGCIISENLKKIDSKSWINMNLYLRNRIIAGIAKAVVVVEARARKGSGSMHQIEFALKRGKPVFVWKIEEKGEEYGGRGGEIDNELIAGYKEYKANKGVKEFTTVDELVRLIDIEIKRSAHHQHPAQRRIDTPY
ncbi:MAG: DNA-processing protein DprA [Candidatus Anstonellales archaeon]